MWLFSEFSCKLIPDQNQRHIWCFSGKLRRLSFSYSICNISIPTTATPTTAGKALKLFETQKTSNFECRSRCSTSSIQKMLSLFVDKPFLFENKWLFPCQQDTSQCSRRWLFSYLASSAQKSLSNSRAVAKWCFMAFCPPRSTFPESWVWRAWVAAPFWQLWAGWDLSGLRWAAASAKTNRPAWTILIIAKQ